MRRQRDKQPARRAGRAVSEARKQKQESDMDTSIYLDLTIGEDEQKEGRAFMNPTVETEACHLKKKRR